MAAHLITNLAATVFVLGDILCAYAYDHRTTDTQTNVESGWTVSTLAASLSCLARPVTATEVASVFVRRVCVYPLYRHRGLALRCVRDASVILSRGRRATLRALLAVYQIFRREESRRVLNDLFIADYCVWVMTAPAQALRSAGAQLAAAASVLSTADVALDLDALEEEAVSRLMATEVRVLCEVMWCNAFVFV